MTLPGPAGDAGVPEPPALSEPVVTGHAGVDEALDRLAELDALPTADHADVYEDVQRRFQHALSDLDGR